MKNRFVLILCLLIFYLGCLNEKIDYSQSQLKCPLESIYGLDDLLKKGKKALSENTSNDENIEIYLDFKSQNNVDYLYVQSNYIYQGAEFPTKYFFDIETVGYDAETYLLNILYIEEPSFTQIMEYNNKLKASKYFIADDLVKTDFFSKIKFTENINAEVVSKKGKVINGKFSTLKTQMILQEKGYYIGKIDGRKNRNTKNAISSYLEANNQSQLKKFLDNIEIEANKIKVKTKDEIKFFEIIRKNDKIDCKATCCIDKVKAISVSYDCGLIETEFTCFGNFEITFKGLNQEYTIPIVNGLISERSVCKTSRKYCFSNDGYTRGYTTECEGHTFEGFHKGGVKFSKGNYSITLN